VGRFAIWFLVVPASLVVGLRLTWGWEAAHRLERSKAALLASLQNFPEPPVPAGAKNGLQWMDYIFGDGDVDLALLAKSENSQPHKSWWEFELSAQESSQIRVLLSSQHKIIERLEKSANQPVAFAPLTREQYSKNVIERYRAQMQRTSLLLAYSFYFARENHDEASELHALVNIILAARISASAPWYLDSRTDIGWRNLAASML